MSTTPPSTVIVYPTPSGSDKVWALLCHLSGFVGAFFLLPLIVYLAMRHDSTYVRDNAREALNFHISLLLYSIVAGILCLIVIGGLLLAVIGLGYVILSIIAAIKATEGGCYSYPLTIRLVK